MTTSDNLRLTYRYSLLFTAINDISLLSNKNKNDNNSNHQESPVADMWNETSTSSAEVKKPTMQDEDAEKHPRGSLRLTSLSIIRWLESLRVPKLLDRGGNAGPEGGTPFIISGLERVVFGTQPACEAVKLLGLAPPRYLCYMVSGFLCDLIQFGIDIILHTVFRLQDASLCWALGFGVSVAFRHTSHRYLVFGDYVGGYWNSLGRMYAGYSIIIVLSTLFNIFMTHYLQLAHYVAWVVTLLWTGIVNYFILKKLWSFGGKEKEEGHLPSSSSGGLEMPSPHKDLEMQARVDRKLQSRKTDKR